MDQYVAGRTWNGWRSTVLNNPCLVCLISVQSNFSSSILLRWLFPTRILLSVFNPKVWCGASRPEALQSKLKTAVHAPGKYRWEKNLVLISVHFTQGARHSRQFCRILWSLAVQVLLFARNLCNFQFCQIWPRDGGEWALWGVVTLLLVFFSSVTYSAIILWLSIN